MEMTIMILAAFALSTLHGQNKENGNGTASETPSDTVVINEIGLPDMKIEIMTTDGNITIYYDAATEATKMFIGEGNELQEVYEDRDGKMYVEKKGTVYVMNHKNLFGWRMRWANADNFPINEFQFPPHATAHRVVEFAKIKPEMLDSRGFRKISNPGADPVYEVPNGGLYHFDTQDRLVAMRQLSENASIQYVYEEQHVIIPEADVKVGNRLPGLFGKKKQQK